MRKTPRTQRAHVWAWLYVQLFGAPDDEDDENDTSESGYERAERGEREPVDKESK